MNLTLKQKERFYRNRRKINKIIISNVKKKGHIIFGARATNEIFPKFLDKQTEDYDIFTKTPKKTARKIERKLDKKFKGNYFEIKTTIFPGGYKVVSRVTKRNVVDYIPIPKDKLKSRKIGGIRYATIDTAKKNIKTALSDPKSKFRKVRDLELRQRIKIFEKLKRQGKKRVKVKKKFEATVKFKPIPRSFI